MDLDLSGKIAFISGSTAGIGLATATKLAKLNATVFINGRTQQRVDEALAKIRSECQGTQPNLGGIVADLGTAEGAEKTFQQLPKVDILVNNMGIFEPKSFELIPDEDWRRFFEINVLSGVRLSRYYLPKMKESNWGRIVFVSSESGINIPSEMIHYGMTKTAQLAVARGLAELTANTNVTVNSVLPGPTKTEGVQIYYERLAREQKKSPEDLEKEFFKSFRPTSLLQRNLTEEEVANMIVYVCSPAASGTNGASLRVEGGLLRSIV